MKRPVKWARMWVLQLLVRQRGSPGARWDAVGRLISLICAGY